jgi:N-acetylglucosamine kinase-like BadF-type ATPase
MKYYLGADLGSSKTDILICDETGRVLGVGKAGSGNHQVVGYEGMANALEKGIRQALAEAGISHKDLSGSGFGISGYDWPSHRADMVATIERVGIRPPYELTNDAILGLVAGSEEGWGLSVVSGSGCTCWGWDRKRKRVGHVSGYGVLMGEAAGGSELVFRAMQIVGHAWSKRGEHTALCEAFIEYSGAENLDDLIEGYTTGRYQIDGKAAPLVFAAAQAGDQAAGELIRWAGRELGELAKAVIRQLEFETLRFDVVLTGSMFAGGAGLIEAMRNTIEALAPRARLVRLEIPPVVGAVLIGMQAGGLEVTEEIRRQLGEKLSNVSG